MPFSEVVTIIRTGVGVIILLLLILPFHYLSNPFMIVPKNEWGLQNTFISKYEANHILYSYSAADRLGKDEIMRQAWVQKLVYSNNY